MIEPGAWLQDTRQGGDAYCVVEVLSDQGLVTIRAARSGRERTVARAMLEHVCTPCERPIVVRA